jgi:hypothetical protein
MLQHMLLMMVAPPLLLLGAPLIPLLRGLPVFAAREFAAPLLNWPLAQRFGRALTHPLVALFLMSAVMLGWHVPKAYELALGSSSWHQFEHAGFLFASLVFWWPVVQPWPSVARWPRWSMVPYLLIADLQNTILSGILVFSDRVLYPTYSRVPRLFGLSALQDQVAAGAIMWVVGSVAFIIPAVIIAIHCLQKKSLAQPAPQMPRRDGTGLDDDLPSARKSAFRPMPPAGLPDRNVQLITFVLLFLVTATAFAWLVSSGTADDDDQTVRSVQQSGPFVISLLSPRELTKGLNEFSILVQDRSANQVLLDSHIDLTAHSFAHTQVATAPVQATYEHSQNKLLQSAELNLPVAGDWTLTIVVRRGTEHAELSVPLQVGAAESSSVIPWARILITCFAGLLLLIYLRRHRPAKVTPLDPSVSSV